MTPIERSETPSVRRPIVPLRPPRVRAGPTSDYLSFADYGLIGNFPQAFSHIDLVNVAHYLEQAKEGEVIEPFDG